MKVFVALALCLGLAACATGNAYAPPPISVQGDSLCEVSRQLDYTPHDTPDTVYQIRSHNAKLKAACGNATRPPLADYEYTVTDAR